MRLHGLLLPVCLATAMWGCTPAFNWREVRFESSGLVALLPCKPDRGTRVVPLAGQTLEMEMQGCESNGALFAIARVDMKDAGPAAGMPAQWKAVTLANAKATGVTESVFQVANANVLSATRVRAAAKKPDGSDAVVYAAWFARGASVFQVMVVGDDVGAEAAETFFSGLQFQ